MSDENAFECVGEKLLKKPTGRTEKEERAATDQPAINAWLQMEIATLRRRLRAAVITGVVLAAGVLITLVVLAGKIESVAETVAK